MGGSSDKPVPGLGSNPKSGVTFDYYLIEKQDSTELKLEVIKDGEVIRTISNQKPKDFKSWPGGPSKPNVLPSKKGYNRFTWDFKRESLPAVDKVFVLGGHDGSTVGPGDYTLKITLGTSTSETTVKILPNPKVKSSLADYAEQQELLKTIEAAVVDMHNSVNSMRSAKAQLKYYAKLLKDNEKAESLLKQGDSLVKRITAWEENLIQPNQKTFQDVINFENKLNAQLLNLRGYIDVVEPKVTAGAKVRLQDLLAQWGMFKTEQNAIITTEMATYNEAFRSLEIPALILSNKK